MFGVLTLQTGFCRTLHMGWPGPRENASVPGVASPWEFPWGANPWSPGRKLRPGVKGQSQRFPGHGPLQAPSCPGPGKAELVGVTWGRVPGWVTFTSSRLPAPRISLLFSPPDTIPLLPMFVLPSLSPHGLYGCFSAIGTPSRLTYCMWLPCLVLKFKTGKQRCLGVSSERTPSPWPSQSH